jgi:hypothetical protein
VGERGSGAFSSILPCPLSRPLFTTLDIATPDRDPSACRVPAPDLQTTGTAAQLLRLASLALATRDARAVTHDSAYRLQRTCLGSAARVLGLVFCLIAVWRRIAQGRQEADRRPGDGKIKGARCGPVGRQKSIDGSDTPHEVQESTTACRFVQPIEQATIRAPRLQTSRTHRTFVSLALRPTWRSQRSTARTSAILLADVPCDTSDMARPRKSRPQDITAPSEVSVDLYDYARPPTSRPGRKPRLTGRRQTSRAVGP